MAQQQTAQQPIAFSISNLTDEQQKKIKEFQKILKDEKPDWGELAIPKDFPIPGLYDAVEAKELSDKAKKDLVLALLDGKFGMALRLATFYNCSAVALALAACPYITVKDIHAPAPKNDNSCALHFAAGYEMNKVVEKFIEKGAYLNIVNNFGNTPLHFACNFSKYETGCLLLKHTGIPMNNNNGIGPVDEDTDPDDESFGEMKKIPGINVAAKYSESIFAKAIQLVRLPKIFHSDYAWLVSNPRQDTCSFEGLMPAKDTQSRHMNTTIHEKIKEICMNIPIKFAYAKDLIEIEKTHIVRNTLAARITKLLQSNEENPCILNLSPEEFSKYRELASKTVSLEQEFGCKFRVNCNDRTLNNYSLESAPLTPELREKLNNIDNALYKISSQNTLIIDKIQLENFSQAINHSIETLRV